MKKLLLFFILATPLFLQAQGKWSVGLTFSPSATYPSSAKNFPVQSSKYGYSIGVFSLFKTGDHFHIQVGLNFQSRNLLAVTNLYITSDMLINSNGNGITDPDTRLDPSRIVTALSQNFQLISLPIKINYNVLQTSSTKFFISTGVEQSFLFNTKTYAKSEAFDSKEWAEKSRNEFLTSLSFGFSVLQPISSDLYFLIGPSYLIDVFNTDKNIINDSHILRIDIKLGYNL